MKKTFTDHVAAQLPYLRRYARALTGSQKRGDNYTIATIDAISRDRSTAPVTRRWCLANSTSPT